MRTVAHVSDLHFGRIKPDLVTPLLESIRLARPDLVVVSGDLTQRARNQQFAAAQRFLSALPQPLLVVPGNHDVPLDLVWIRLLAPWLRYRRWVGSDLEPCFQDDEIAAVGVNTVAPFQWQRGRIGRRAVARACARLVRAEGRIRIVITHHPFVHGPGITPKAPMRGAAAAIRKLAGCGADVILSGHLHKWSAEVHRTMTSDAGSVILVRAGTGLSTRMRGQGNDYNVLRIETDAISVCRFAASATDLSYRPVEEKRFVRQNGTWIAAAEVPGL